MTFFSGSPQRWTCGFSSGLEYFNTAENVRQGKIKIFDYERTELDLDNLPWTGTGPGVVEHPSWHMWIHSLKWLDVVIENALKDQSTDGVSSLDVAVKVVKSWTVWNAEQDHFSQPAWDGHASGMRTTTLVALSELVDEEWLARAIRDHMVHLQAEENFDGHWNHGLVQTMALLGAALRLNESDAVELAKIRLTETLAEMIDSEGAINEQATAYARYIERLLRQVIKIAVEYNFDDAQEFQKKLKDIRLFMAHSLEPSGEFVQLGDSYPEGPNSFHDTELEYVKTHGRKGRIPTDRVKVYDRGYVFGRSGWGTHRPLSDESFYSLRFGPSRIIHGHNDHMSLTWYDNQRQLIVDSGHSGYRPGEFRDYLRSPAAHNVLEVVGARHDWSANTDLDSHKIGPQAASFELSDDAYSVRRNRSVLAIDKGPMIIVDRANAGNQIAHFRQLWHIAPEFQLASSTETEVRFESARGDLDLVLLRFNVTSSDLQSHTGMSYWKGSRNPIQGFVARFDGEEKPAPCVGFDVKADKLFLLTALVALPKNSSLGWSFRRGPRGVLILRIHVGQVSYAINVGESSGDLELRVPVDSPA